MKFTDRTFGVEIEFTGSNHRRDVAAALNAAGIRAIWSDTYHSSRPADTWVVEADSSCGSEVISPILRGSEGLAAVRRVMDVMTNVGCRVSVRCGFHVHHGASDLSPMALRNLLALYIKYEGVIDNMHPVSRRNNDYCRPMSGIPSFAATGIADSGTRRRNLIERRLREAARSRNGVQLYRNTYGAGHRYAKLNYSTRSGPRPGTLNTVEFRQHAGTLNADKAIAWIVLTQLMVERSASMRGQTSIRGAVSFTMFLWALRALHNNQQEDEYVRTAVRVLRTRYLQFSRLTLNADVYTGSPVERRPRRARRASIPNLPRTEIVRTPVDVTSIGDDTVVVFAPASAGTMTRELQMLHLARQISTNMATLIDAAGSNFQNLHAAFREAQTHLSVIEGTLLAAAQNTED